MSRFIRSLAAVGLALAPFFGPSVVGPLIPQGAGGGSAEVVTSFADPEIDESSGLVVRGRWIHTVDDSGDGPVVYTVDRVTGETARVTTYADDDPEDVEALAPGSGGTVWVGDIGDNRRARGTLSVHRLRPAGGRVEPATYRLRYPDGPHDAEALLVHPRTGRLLVVTKRPFLGAEVFRAPARLRPGKLHELEHVSTVPGLVTDGTFLPDGRHVLLRTYSTAAVLTYPGLEPVGDFDLPAQEQGEGVAVGDDGRVYLSSEGVGAEVLVMDLPVRIARALRPEPATSPSPAPGPTPSPAPSGSAGDGDGPTTASGGGGDDGADLLLPAGGYAVAGGLAAAVLLGLRAARRRGRRTP